MHKFWAPAAALILFICGWEAACAFFRIDPWILPPPSAIASSMREDASLLLHHLGSTLGLAMSGVGIGLVAGVLLAIVLHLFPLIRTVISPFVIASQNVPLIALGPLLIIWFGFGLTPKLVLLTLVGFFPVAWSMLAGLGRAEPQLREYMSMIGATRMQMLLRLELPASVPYLFAGLKITVTYSVTTAIVAEWLGASRGIGYYLVLQYKGFDISAVFGSIICIVGLCLMLYGMAARLERMAVFWRPGEQPAKAGERE